MNFIKLYYTKGYVPYWTLFKYKPFQIEFDKYASEFKGADSIDFVYYKTLHMFEEYK